MENVQYLSIIFLISLFVSFLTRDKIKKDVVLYHGKFESLGYKLRND
jgi:hypothetical protein